MSFNPFHAQQTDAAEQRPASEVFASSAAQQSHGIASRFASSGKYTHQQLEAGDELKELEAQIQHDLGLLHLYCGEAQDAGGRFVRAADILNAKLDHHGQGPHDHHTSPIVQRIKKKLKISLLDWGEVLNNTAADDDREALEFALNIYEQGMAVQMDPSTGASECLLSFVRVGDE